MSSCCSHLNNFIDVFLAALKCRKNLKQKQKKVLIKKHKEVFYIRPAVVEQILWFLPAPCPSTLIPCDLCLIPGSTCASALVKGWIFQMKPVLCLRQKPARSPLFQRATCSRVWVEPCVSLNLNSYHEMAFAVTVFSAWKLLIPDLAEGTTTVPRFMAACICTQERQLIEVLISIFGPSTHTKGRIAPSASLIEKIVPSTMSKPEITSQAVYIRPIFSQKWWRNANLLTERMG